MSEELGRPSYKARPATPPSASPPLTIEDVAGSTRARPAKVPEAPRPARAPKPPKPPRSPEPAAPKARRREGPPAAADRPEYTPADQGRGLGYVLWHLVRITVLVMVKLVRAMIKIALSPFHGLG
ncbi:MAG TPA: hypothetical protein VFN97_11160 [Actinospica sp.]|nr:hypothetical protein [Actinospica sp.]